MGAYNGVNALLLLKSLSQNKSITLLPNQIESATPKLLHNLYNTFRKLQPSMHALKKKKTIKNKGLLRKVLRRRKKLLKIHQQGPNSVRNIIGEF
jgi:hypothetical protein